MGQLLQDPFVKSFAGPSVGPALQDPFVGLLFQVPHVGPPLQDPHYRALCRTLLQTFCCQCLGGPGRFPRDRCGGTDLGGKASKAQDRAPGQSETLGLVGGVSLGKEAVKLFKTFYQKMADNGSDICEKTFDFIFLSFSKAAFI